MKRYVLGVDGGGTKTQCALFTVQGQRVDLMNWGTTNHECLAGGMNQLQEELEALVKALLQRNGIAVSDIEYSVWGMAGVDTLAQQEHISGLISKVGFEEFLLCNDSYLGIKGGLKSGFGICVIHGTGCTVAGMNSKGQMLQIGGQGALSGDLGGAGSIGAMGVASAYNQLFKLGSQTTITDKLFEQLHIENKHMFLDTLTSHLNNGRISLAELNRVVYDAAANGDEKACRILREVGEDIGNSIAGMINELFCDDAEMDIVLAGSLNLKEKDSIVQQIMREQVARQTPGVKIQYTVPLQPPVAGAVVWALEKANPNIDVFHLVRSQF